MRSVNEPTTALNIPIGVDKSSLPIETALGKYIFYSEIFGNTPQLLTL